MSYKEKWLPVGKGEIDVIIEDRSFRVKYKSARGVMTKATEVTSFNKKLTLKEEVSFLSDFRDKRGRRMPPVTSACAIIMSIYGRKTASARDDKRKIDITVENLGQGDSNTHTQPAVYVEKTNGEVLAEYKKSKTDLDRLFSEVFGRAECTGSAFKGLKEDDKRLPSGWLNTNNKNTFWELVKKHFGATVDLNSRLDAPIGDEEDAKNTISRALKKGLKKTKEEKYAILFPINITNTHHTLAHAEYDKSTKELVVTYFDSREIDANGIRMCDIIRSAFSKAVESKIEESKIKYTRKTGIMQQQVDCTSCGVFVCIAMLEARDGKVPKIYERTIDESDIRKVRCIIAKTLTDDAKQTAHTASTANTALYSAADDDDLIVMTPPDNTSLGSIWID